MRKLTILRHIISLMLIVVLGFTITYSWFARSNNIDPQLSDATIIKQYFHTGSGTEEDPFVITRPVHYYNLVQLFQRTSGFAVDGDSSKVYYFQLGYELDNTSEGLEFYNYDDDGNQITTDGNKYSKELNLEFYNGSNALLPIGTSDIPFNDVFNGSGLTVKNLHVKATETVGDVTFGTADIGIFGYVTEEASISNVYYSNFDIDLTGTDYTRTVSSHNEVVHDTNNTGTADVVYVGYVAGHIVDATCFSNFYINSCEIIGQTTSFRSDWGYFGYCENAETIDEFISRVNGINGGDDWGGSIDMKSLNLRLKNILNGDVSYYSNTKTNYRYFAYTQNNEMKLSVGRGSRIDTYLQRNPENEMVVYNLLGSGTHYYSKGSCNIPGTVIPLLVNDDGSTSSKNTGYIISESRYETSGNYSGKKTNNNGSIRSSSYKISHIGNSLSDTAVDKIIAFGSGTNGDNISYIAANTEILTNKSVNYTASNFALIKDSYNQNHTVANSYLTSYTKNDSTTPEALGLTKYNEARASLDDVLNGARFVHGIHFMDEDLAYNKTNTVASAKINGEIYSNYVFPTSCIDFHLKEAGKINFFGGSYYNIDASLGSYADCFFSLSYITRTNNNLTSNSIKEISYIYKNTAATDHTNRYIYRFSDGTYSGDNNNIGDLVFDMRYLSETPPVDNALYYFEIPVNAGEYALSGVSGHDAGGYLMYLDIAASGEEEKELIEVDNFANVEYRSANDTIERNILILTYKQNSNLNVSVKVIFDKEENCYSIFTSANIPITVTILDSNYTYKFNNITISSEVGSYTITSP